MLGKLAIITRHHGPDDPRLPELRRALACERLRKAIDRDGSDLDQTQRAALAALVLEDRPS